MFTHRSDEKELLDLGKDYYTIEEYQHCMKALYRVNVLLGCFHSTVKALKHFPPTSSLLDIGCGGGDILINLSRYYPHMYLKGVDISAEAIQTANDTLHAFKAGNKESKVSFSLQTQPKIDLEDDSIDIILATMVCHHLSDVELIEFFKKSVQASRKMVMIHDLHRHAIAYWFYKIFSPVLFRNRLITHDGLISIRRGFLRSELKSLLHQAGISNYQLKWRFPFRWQLILFKNADYLKGI